MIIWKEPQFSQLIFHIRRVNSDKLPPPHTDINKLSITRCVVATWLLSRTNHHILRSTTPFIPDHEALSIFKRPTFWRWALRSARSGGAVLLSADGIIIILLSCRVCVQSWVVAFPRSTLSAETEAKANNQDQANCLSDIDLSSSFYARHCISSRTAFPVCLIFVHSTICVYVCVCVRVVKCHQQRQSVMDARRLTPLHHHPDSAHPSNRTPESCRHTIEYGMQMVFAL